MDGRNTELFQHGELRLVFDRQAQHASYAERRRGKHRERAEVRDGIGWGRRVKSEEGGGVQDRAHQQQVEERG